MVVEPGDALGGLPLSLRTELIEEFQKITRNYRERHWEAAELDGGRFSEIVFSILKGHLDGDNYPPRASKPQRFNDACKRLENADATKYSDSARISIPRMLVGLYDVRNRRGVGHVGGEVNANHMDAELVLHTAQWVMAELVRLFHDLDIAEATAVVDALVDRTVPVLWQVGNVTRVLDTSLSIEDQTLLLLYAELRGLHEKDLALNLERNRLDNYRKVLRRLHESRYIDYDATTRVSVISPLGIRDVETKLLTS